VVVGIGALHWDQGDKSTPQWLVGGEGGIAHRQRDTVQRQYFVEQLAWGETFYMGEAHASELPTNQLGDYKTCLTPIPTLSGERVAKAAAGIDHTCVRTRRDTHAHAHARHDKRTCECVVQDCCIGGYTAHSAPHMSSQSHTKLSTVSGVCRVWCQMGETGPRRHC
jgi:hypothetical protein